jgi:hypothetical protein
VLELG